MMTEGSLQICCADWLRLAYPDGESVMWHHSPNEHTPDRTRSKGAFIGYMKKQAAMGRRKGWPDFEFWWGCGNTWEPIGCGMTREIPVSRSALFELKKPGGRLSPAQREIRDWARRLGIPWGMGTSLDDLQEFLRGVPGFPRPRGGW